MCVCVTLVFTFICLVLWDLSNLCVIGPLLISNLCVIGPLLISGVD